MLSDAAGVEVMCLLFDPGAPLARSSTYSNPFAAYPLLASCHSTIAIDIPPMRQASGQLSCHFMCSSTKCSPLEVSCAPSAFVAVMDVIIPSHLRSTSPFDRPGLPLGRPLTHALLLSVLCATC